MNTSRPLLLDNPVQKYAWGSKSAIQNLVGLEPDGHTPWAELWMGAHPKSPSRLEVNGQWMGLDQWISENPGAVLGKYAAETFEATLPYLLKILAADQPLSIQAHPDRKHAQEGFKRENRLGIPVEAPHRNYRDPWPKPELICSIKPFGAMIGFRKPDEIKELIKQFCPEMLGPEIRMLKDQPDENGLKNFFYSIMTMENTRRKKAIGEAMARTENPSSLEANWIRRLYKFYPEDIGVLSPAFLNLVTIEPNEAIFLAPGIIHAYLYGVAVEIMANSDNVLRGGLTQKHIDPEELMRVVNFSHGAVQRITPQPAGPCEMRYCTDAREFALSRLKISRKDKWQAPGIHSAEILFCIKGEAKILINATDFCLSIKAGQSALVPAAAGKYEIIGEAVLYRAGVRL
ncbi:MAG: mannose-6-phosphate isomerase, class I [Desulfosalsimonas sp.]